MIQSHKIPKIPMTEDQSAARKLAPPRMRLLSIRLDYFVK
jgi:hypothetical protein